jgi:hypothetical protein
MSDGTMRPAPKSECFVLRHEVPAELREAEGEQCVVETVESSSGQADEEAHRDAEHKADEQHQWPGKAEGDREIGSAVRADAHRGQGCERLQAGGSHDQGPHHVDRCVDADDAEEGEEALGAHCRRNGDEQEEAEDPEQWLLVSENYFALEGLRVELTGELEN